MSRLPRTAGRGNRRPQTPPPRHSGYPGGLKTRTLNDMLERRPEEVIRLAVRGMLPKNRLARKQLTKLKVYAGPAAGGGRPPPEGGAPAEPVAETADEPEDELEEVDQTPRVTPEIPGADL